MRHYWQIERLMFGDWIGTDWYASGETSAAALEWATGIATCEGWEGVRLGRELTDREHLRYCDFAWITIN